MPYISAPSWTDSQLPFSLFAVAQDDSRELDPDIPWEPVNPPPVDKDGDPDQNPRD